MPRESTLGERDGENLVLDDVASKCFRALCPKRWAYRERELWRASPTGGSIDGFRLFIIRGFFRLGPQRRSLHENQNRIWSGQRSDNKAPAARPGLCPLQGTSGSEPRLRRTENRERKMPERNRTRDSAHVGQNEGSVGAQAPFSWTVDPLKIVDGLPKKRALGLTPESTPPIAPQATH
jgi:hypothetical protein